MSAVDDCAPARRPWSQTEVDLTVADYFHMLRLEYSGQAYSKAEHRRRLQSHLDRRSDGAIEMKHQNTSAVLAELGVMRLRGYQPLPNYQRSLFTAVERRVLSDRLLDVAALAAVTQPAETPVVGSFDQFVVAPQAARTLRVGDPRLEWIRHSAAKRDYLERESRNRALGLAGEKLALEYETRRLYREGRSDLADRIEHVSESRGDGLGYDILSYDCDGRERFIEVKTTSFTGETPFFISRNEVRFSEEFAQQFQLYRLFNFRDVPQMFALPGAVSSSCSLDPCTYQASPVQHG